MNVKNAFNLLHSMINHTNIGEGEELHICNVNDTTRSYPIEGIVKTREMMFGEYKTLHKVLIDVPEPYIPPKHEYAINILRIGKNYHFWQKTIWILTIDDEKIMESTNLEELISLKGKLEVVL